MSSPEETCKLCLNCPNPKYSEDTCNRYCSFYEPKDLNLFIYSVINETNYNPEIDGEETQFGVALYPTESETEDSIKLDQGNGVILTAKFPGRTITPEQLIGMLVDMVHKISDQYVIPYQKLTHKKSMNKPLIEAIDRRIIH